MLFSIVTAYSKRNPAGRRQELLPRAIGLDLVGCLAQGRAEIVQRANAAESARQLHVVRATRVTQALAVLKQVQDMAIQEVLSAPRSPWQRAYVERVIGTIRRECLDHVIVLN